MNDRPSGDHAASTYRRGGADGRLSAIHMWSRRCVTHSAAAYAWLAQTFNGLTWKRFGIFCVLVEFCALHRGPSIYAIAELFPALGHGRFPWMPVGALGLAKAFFHTFLAFVPVLLAAIAVENRGPRAGTAQILSLCIAVVVGQIIGLVLYAGATAYLYPDGFMKFGPMSDPAERWRVFGGVGIRFLVDSTMAAGFYFYLKRDTEMASALHQEQVEHEEVERENAEARLQVMQAQIEPHFLFNTLASVRRLYEVDRSSGRAMLQHLSRYLTASLPGMRESRPTLERELALALAYLSVQKIRMESRLTFDVDVPAALKAAVVPPMMVATLVENAVIHGLSPLSSGGHIRISAYAKSGKLVLEVADNGRGLQETWGGGVGLANIRARLNSAYGSNAYLNLTQGNHGGATATIELPLAAIHEAKAA